MRFEWVTLDFGSDSRQTEAITAFWSKRYFIWAKSSQMANIDFYRLSRQTPARMPFLQKADWLPPDSRAGYEPSKERPFCH
jgi:hypothetical protein